MFRNMFKQTLDAYDLRIMFYTIEKINHRLVIVAAD